MFGSTGYSNHLELEGRIKEDVIFEEWRKNLKALMINSGLGVGSFRWVFVPYAEGVGEWNKDAWLMAYVDLMIFGSG